MWKVHRERENLLFTGSLSKRPRQLGLCPSKARRPELQLALPHGGQAPQIVGPVFIVFPYALSGNLSGSRLAGTWTSTPVWDNGMRGIMSVAVPWHQSQVRLLSYLNMWLTSCPRRAIHQHITSTRLTEPLRGPGTTSLLEAGLYYLSLDPNLPVTSSFISSHGPSPS